jgi:hypothetical protein
MVLKLGKGAAKPNCIFYNVIYLNRTATETRVIIDQNENSKPEIKSYRWGHE